MKINKTLLKKKCIWQRDGVWDGYTTNNNWWWVAAYAPSEFLETNKLISCPQGYPYDTRFIKNRERVYIDGIEYSIVASGEGSYPINDINNWFACKSHLYITSSETAKALVQIYIYFDRNILARAPKKKKPY